MQTRYNDIQELAKMVPTLSSRTVTVIPPDPDLREELIAELKAYGTENPPITADPPEHSPFKRLILPFFSPRAVAGYTQMTENLCNSLLDQLEGRETCDGAVEYAQQIPPRVIAFILGIDMARADEFTEWTRELLELGQTQPRLRQEARHKIRDFFFEEIADRRANRREDVISQLVDAEVEGEKLSDQKIAGICNLLLVAGGDRPPAKPPHRVWHRHPPLRRLQPGADGVAGGAAPVVRALPRLRTDVRGRRDLGRRSGSRTPQRADPVAGVGPALRIARCRAYCRSIWCGGKTNP